MTSEAYKDGCRAYRLNPDRLNNPHPAGSQECNDYERGWTQELKRSGAYSGAGGGYDTFHSPRQYFQATFQSSHIDPEEEKRKAAEAYAKAKGRG